MVDERRWGAAGVRVMRQPRGRRVGKGLRSGGRAGNVATVRGMRRSRRERGSARATRQRAAVARRYAGATARRRSREHGALLLLSRGYGQGEGRGSKCSFLCRVMLRHATGMFHVKHSQNGEQWKGLVRGGRGAWHRARQDAPGRQVPCACERWVAHARMGFGCSDAKERARGLGWGLRMRARGLVV